MKACKLLLAVVIVFSFILVQPVPQAQAAWGGTLDDFDSDLVVTVSPPTLPSPAWAANRDGGVVGHDREIVVRFTGGSGAILVESSAADGYLLHQQDPGVYGSSIITWDGHDSARTLTPSGLGGVDLTRPGGHSDALGLYIGSCDLGARLVLTVYANDPSGANWSRAILMVPPLTSNTWFYLRYAGDFSQQGGTGADWTNVGAVALVIDGRQIPGLNITINTLAFGQSPTAVDLISFSASSAGNGVHVEWETASEVDNLGFNLYRAGSATGPWTKLNDTLIPGQAPGIPTGAVYTFEDNSISAGGTYYYRLEDVDIHGHGTFHGPVKAILKARQ